MMSQTVAQQGDLRLVASWLIDEGQHEHDTPTYGERVCSDLESAIDTANKNDKHGEGCVYQEEFDGVFWQVIGEYDSQGHYWTRQ